MQAAPDGATEAQHSAGGFVIGQPVRIAPTCECFADWRGETLYFAGVVHWPKRYGDGQGGELNYYLAERWPPKHSGDITDGWREGEFEPLPPDEPASSRSTGETSSQSEGGA